MLGGRKCVDSAGYLVDCPSTDSPLHYSPLGLYEEVEVVSIGGRKHVYRNGVYLGEAVWDPATGMERVRTGYTLNPILNTIEPVYYTSNPLAGRGLPVELQEVAGRIHVYEKPSGRYIGEAVYDPATRSYRLLKNREKQGI